MRERVAVAVCGLIGAVLAPHVALDLDAGLRALVHRGPDGGGAFVARNVHLGHRRLSIIDLTEAASQPMTEPSRGTIVFNGEIYDHATHRARLEARGERFSSRSDTEVLLRGMALDGIASLRALHGMYAFAWLEPDGRTLWLARDHAGIKPLYVWRGPQGVLFASEVRALAALVRSTGASTSLEPRALAGFLSWGSVPEPLTMLAGATMLAPDEALAIDVHDPSRVRSVPIDRRWAGRAPIAVERAVATSVEAVREATRRHLVADHPVALFLSGGIDSGVLAAEMSRSGAPRPQAITVHLGTRGTDDEPAIARRLAARLGIALHTVALDDWQGRLDHAIDAYDQPSVDGLNTYLVAGIARDLGFRVALSGLGADEVFGGYRHFRGAPHALAGMHLPRPLAHRAARLLLASSDPRVRRAAMIVDGAGHHEPPASRWRRTLDRDTVAALLPDVAPPDAWGTGGDPLHDEQRAYLLDTLLRDTDVLGMAHGVEIRAPFLDPAVLTTGDAIGSHAILDRARAPKWILRDGWRDVLDPSTLARRKSGFALDLGAWLAGAGRARLDHAVDALRNRPAVHRATLDAFVSRWRPRLATGHPSASTAMLALVHLETQFARWS